jgi:hypothetical protein
MTLESEHGISYFKLLVPEDEFYKNAKWYIGWEVHYGGSIRREKYYGMNDGTVVEIGFLAYSPDSWCKEYEESKGIEKVINSLKADLRRHDPIVRVAGELPDEIKKAFPSLARSQ